jgi:hypothetical protein
MTDDFLRLREHARTSAIATASRRLIAAATAAWTTSAVGGWWAATIRPFAGAAAAARLRWSAIAIAVAAAGHVVLRSFLSPTVAPAMPLGLYVVIAMGGAVIAWQAEAFHRAWRGSRASRVFKSFAADDGN